MGFLPSFNVEQLTAVERR